jgi:branched-chain amino acid transport system permease protein
LNYWGGWVGEVLSPVIIGIIVQVAVVILLCVGFTFTYMMEKFPNFAHASLAMVGTVVSFSLVKINGFTPYQTIPVSTLFCGLLGVALYRFVVRPIKATGAREITLTFAFFALTQVIASLINIYSYWYLSVKRSPTGGFYFFSGDFEWQGYPGVLLVSVPTCIIIVAALWLFLARVKQGVAFRAVAEDETLASSLGVNVEEIHILSWFITGALAGLAGGIIPLWKYTGLDANDEFLILVMTGSVIGGLSTVAGAVVGGAVVVASQKLLTYLGLTYIGIGTLAYESLYPMVMVVTILMIQPEGIMGTFDKTRTPTTPPRIRIRDAIEKIASMIRRLGR